MRAHRHGPCFHMSYCAPTRPDKIILNKGPELTSYGTGIGGYLTNVNHFLNIYHKVNIKTPADLIYLWQNIIHTKPKPEAILIVSETNAFSWYSSCSKVNSICACIQSCNSESESTKNAIHFCGIS